MGVGAGRDFYWESLRDAGISMNSDRDSYRDLYRRAVGISVGGCQMSFAKKSKVGSWRLEVDGGGVVWDDVLGGVLGFGVRCDDEAESDCP